MTVCERIDALLKEKNMSRRQLAISAGIAPSSLQSAMQRNTTISLDMLFPISEVLEVDVQQLSEGELSEEEKAQRDFSWSEVQEDHGDILSSFINSFISSRPCKEIKLLSGLVSHYDKLSTDGMKEAEKRIGELARLAEYQRPKTAPETPLECGTLTDTPKQERPSEGQISPADGLSESNN